MPLTITPANVVQVGTNESVIDSRYPLGYASATAGQAVALDTFTAPTAPVWKPLDSSDATNAIELAGRDGYGILLTGGDTGQPCHVAKAGAILDLGVALSAGELYAASILPGRIELYTAVPTGGTDYVTILGYANASNQLILIRLITNFQRA